MTPIQLPAKIEHLPIASLAPYSRNARTHSPEQIASLVRSMQQFGWTAPVLIGAGNLVLAGHARLEAARQLKLSVVPAIRFDHLSEVQQRALILADNRLALDAGWDEALLSEELKALQVDDFDLDVLGFSQDELEALLADPVEETAGKTDEDAAPEAQEQVVSRLGDVWLLGPHRLLCGDSTQMAAVETLLAGGLADMVFTDPPYNVNYGATMKDKLRGKDRKIANDNLGSEFEKFLHDACVNLLSVAKGAVYICMSSSELHTLEKAFTEAGGHWSTFVIWAKNTFTMGRSDYQRQYEPILYGWKEGTDHFWCGARDQGDIWFIKKPHVNDLHPTMKPVELVERAVRNSSKTRDTVLDPFGGSGTTLIACEKAGRQARLIELAPNYCDVIVRRWQEFTGKTATLEATGEQFNAIEPHEVAA